jgi:hypothetical protein
MAKFRGLMYQIKYGAVIGFKKIIAWKLLLGTYIQKNAFILGQSQRRIYPGTSNHGISPNDSVKLQWLTPHKSFAMVENEQ